MRISLNSLAVCTLLCFSAAAQKTQPVNSGQLIAEGVQLHDQGKYREAVETYQKIPRNDTNYVFALYEIAYSQSADSNTYLAATQTCREGLKLDEGQYEHDFLLLLASNIDNSGDMEHAIKLYDSALVKYPNSQLLLLNKGVTLIRQKKYDKAEAIFKDLLIRNPYYPSAHLRLGQCALQKGQLVEAMMCFYTYLLNNPSGSQSKYVIKMLDNISKATDDVMEVVNKRQHSPEGNFALVEQIILSKIALEKGYKVLADLDDPIVRQLQVMMEKLEFDSSNPDFYMQFYVPYLKNIFGKKMFEPAVMQAFSDINIESIQRYVKKNSKTIDQAIIVFAETFNPIRSTRELDFVKRQTKDPIYHFDDGVLIAKGKMNKEDLNGKWEFYHKNGNIKTTGEYDAAGKKTGKWTYYFENGKLNATDCWKNGEQDGEDLIYNRQGTLIEKSLYKNGKRHGEKLAYFYPGHLRLSSTFKDGMETGTYKEYFTNGRLKIQAATADDDLHGPYTYYHENGQLQIAATYDKGKLTGSYKSYYDNGQLEFEANYANGEIHGEAKTYHLNSKLKRKASYVNGVIEGEELEYNDESILTQKVLYKKGKAEGLAEYFGHDGKLYSTFLFDNDRLKQAKYFDKSGKEISVSNRQSKKIDLDVYSEDGIKVRHLIYNDKGEKQDRETNYYNSGQISETNDYKDGEQEGRTVLYYPNGAKQAEVDYKAGKKHGAVKNYFLNGRLDSEGWYVDGECNGDWIEYDEKGNIVSITTYLNDEVYGTKRSFYPNGKPQDEVVYHAGWFIEFRQFDTLGRISHTVKLPNGNGKYSGVHLNGKTSFEGNYVNGNVDGVFKTYYFDGSPSLYKVYDKGLLHGDYIDYYYGGKIYSQGKYELGKQIGTWKYYSRDGKLTREENFKNGELDGITIFYHSNGKPEREIHYKGGSKSTQKWFAADGQLCNVLHFRNDVITGYSYNDKNNQLVPVIPVRGGNGKVKSYYANGQVSAEMQYADGQLVGPYKIYFPDGKVYYEEEDQINGQTMGKIVEYYANGKKQSEYNFYYDKADGAYKEYYEDGKLKEEGSHYNGNNHGTVKMYDASGKLVEKRQYYYGSLVNVSK